jgi:hypothetical protein
MEADAVMTAHYLADLTRAELDELTTAAEEADRVARVVFTTVPLWRTESPAMLASAAGVAQDTLTLCTDCYDASVLLTIAEMDRLLGRVFGHG